MPTWVSFASLDFTAMANTAFVAAGLAVGTTGLLDKGGNCGRIQGGRLQLTQTQTTGYNKDRLQLTVGQQNLRVVGLVGAGEKSTAVHNIQIGVTPPAGSYPGESIMITLTAAGSVSANFIYPNGSDPNRAAGAPFPALSIPLTGSQPGAPNAALDLEYDVQKVGCGPFGLTIAVTTVDPTLGTRVLLTTLTATTTNAQLNHAGFCQVADIGLSTNSTNASTGLWKKLDVYTDSAVESGHCMPMGVASTTATLQAQAFRKATTYTLHRSTSSGFTPGAGNIVGAAQASPTFTDAGLPANTTYYYAIGATDGVATVYSGNVLVQTRMASALETRVNFHGHSYEAGQGGSGPFGGVTGNNMAGRSMTRLAALDATRTWVGNNAAVAGSLTRQWIPDKEYWLVLKRAINGRGAEIGAFMLGTNDNAYSLAELTAWHTLGCAGLTAETTQVRTVLVRTCESLNATISAAKATDINSALAAVQALSPSTRFLSGPTTQADFNANKTSFGTGQVNPPTLPGSWFQTDSLHPNDEGHRQLGEPQGDALYASYLTTIPAPGGGTLTRRKEKVSFTNPTAPLASVALTTTPVKLFATRDKGNAGWQCANNTGQTVYFVEVQSGEAAPSAATCAAAGQKVADGGYATGGSVNGDVYACTATGSGNVYPQQMGRAVVV